MKRRTFLQSLAAAAIAPTMPSLAFAKITAQSSFTPANYQWAETIVRAHNQSSIAMLQRHLKIDAKVATSLQNELVKRGVLVSKANAYGIHTAVKPLYEGAFLKPSNAVSKTATQQEVGDAEADNSIEDDEDARLLMIASVDAELEINPNFLMTT